MVDTDVVGSLNGPGKAMPFSAYYVEVSLLVRCQWWCGGPVGKGASDFPCISPQMLCQILLCSPHCSPPCHICTNNEFIICAPHKFEVCSNGFQSRHLLAQLAQYADYDDDDGQSWTLSGVKTHSAHPPGCQSYTKCIETSGIRALFTNVAGMVVVADFPEHTTVTRIIKVVNVLT